MKGFFGIVGVLSILSGGCASAALTNDAPERGTSSTQTLSGVPAERPSIGGPAPSFIAPSSDGTNVDLASYRGRTVVLWFFTKADTPAAEREAEAFREVAPKLKAKGILVVGISTDSLESQRAFAERMRLPFPLAADPSGSVARAYGVPVTYGLTDRRTFVIGPSGAVEKIYDEVVDPTAHVDDVVRQVARPRSS